MLSWLFWGCFAKNKRKSLQPCSQCVSVFLWSVLLSDFCRCWCQRGSAWQFTCISHFLSAVCERIVTWCKRWDLPRGISFDSDFTRQSSVSPLFLVFPLISLTCFSPPSFVQALLSPLFCFPFPDGLLSFGDLPSSLPDVPSCLPVPGIAVILITPQPLHFLPAASCIWIHLPCPSVTPISCIVVCTNPISCQFMLYFADIFHSGTK